MKNDYNISLINSPKAGLTLNDVYDSQSVFKFSLRLHSHTSCSYRVLKKCSYREYSAFKNSSKMIQEQAAATVCIALISEKNKSREKGKKEKSV